MCGLLFVLYVTCVHCVLSHIAYYYYMYMCYEMTYGVCFTFCPLTRIHCIGQFLAREAFCQNQSIEFCVGEKFDRQPMLAYTRDGRERGGQAQKMALNGLKKHNIFISLFLIKLFSQIIFVRWEIQMSGEFHNVPLPNISSANVSS